MTHQCLNGCKALIEEPSKVICKNCQMQITAKLHALIEGTYHLIKWENNPGDLKREDLPWL